MNDALIGRSVRRFDDRVTGRPRQIRQTGKGHSPDIDPAEIDKNVKSTVPVWGRLPGTLPAHRTRGAETYPQWLQRPPQWAMRRGRK